MRPGAPLGGQDANTETAETKAEAPAMPQTATAFVRADNPALAMRTPSRLAIGIYGFCGWYTPRWLSSQYVQLLEETLPWNRPSNRTDPVLGRPTLRRRRAGSRGPEQRLRSAYGESQCGPSRFAAEAVQRMSRRIASPAAGSGDRCQGAGVAGHRRLPALAPDPAT